MSDQEKGPVAPTTEPEKPISNDGSVTQCSAECQYSSPITTAEEAGTERACTDRAIYRTLATGLCFAVFAALAEANHTEVALPFAVAGWLLSRGDRNQWQA